MRFMALRAVAVALLAGLVVLAVDGCAVPPTSPDAGEAATAPRSAAPSPLVALERLLPTPKAEPQSQVAPVMADSAVDPAEDAAEPGAEFERGGASWYGSRFHGRRTASGERFDIADLTAAHRTLPFGTMVCVRNLANRRVVLVRINDRGPASRRRVIDISQAAADVLAMVGMGVQTVALSRPVSGQDRCE